MANMTGSMKNWNPGAGKGKNEAKANALTNTEAREASYVKDTNELKDFVGKSSKPKGPFGIRGKEF